jgi:hypothetical protein
MMIISYVLGQKYYPVPYAKKKLVAYIVLTLIVVLIHRGIVYLYPGLLFSIITATMLMIAFSLFVIKIEKKEFQKFPVIGKYF